MSFLSELRAIEAPLPAREETLADCPALRCPLIEGSAWFSGDHASALSCVLSDAYEGSLAGRTPETFLAELGALIREIRAWNGYSAALAESDRLISEDAAVRARVEAERKAKREAKEKAEAEAEAERQRLAAERREWLALFDEHRSLAQQKGGGRLDTLTGEIRIAGEVVAAVWHSNHNPNAGLTRGEIAKYDAWGGGRFDYGSGHEVIDPAVSLDRLRELIAQAQTERAARIAAAQAEEDAQRAAEIAVYNAAIRERDEERQREREERAKKQRLARRRERALVRLERWREIRRKREAEDQRAACDAGFSFGAAFDNL